MRRSILLRVIVVVVGAGLASLAVSALVVLRTVRANEEASLVEHALHRGELLRERVDGRLTAERTRLRTIVAAEQQLDATNLISPTVRSLRVLDSGEVFVEASNDEAATRALAGGLADGMVVGTRRVVLAEERGDLRAEALLDFDDVLGVPTGWTGGLEPIAVGARRDVRARRGGNHVSVTAPCQNADVAIVLEVPLAPAEAAAKLLAARTSAWSLLAVIPLLLLAWLFGSAVTKPVRRLHDAVAHAGDGPVQLPTLKEDEIGALGAAIAEMSRRMHADARALHAAVVYGREARRLVETRDVLASLERSLAEVFPEGAWSVVPAEVLLGGLDLEGGDEHREALVALLEAESSGEEAKAHRLDESTLAVVLRDGERAHAIAVGDGDIENVELLCQTALVAIRNIELLHAALTNEKLAMLGRLSAGVAHEVSNPLAYVIANLEELAEQLSGEQAQMAKDARGGAERIAKIVRDLRPLSRGKNDSYVEDVDVTDIARETIEVAGPRHPEVALVFRGDDVLPARCDRGRVEQALLNLTVNAMDAAKHADEPRVHVSVRRERKRALVRIEDNGPGIPPEVRQRLFEAFFTTKGEEGTGLGLFLSRSFVQAQGGDIRLVSSRRGKTVFELSLPLHMVPRRSDRPSAPDRPRRFLLIDDEAMIVRSLARVLRRYGEVVSTTDPEEALEKAVAENFDLVLCDLHMPKLSGAELVGELRKRRPESAERVVILTGSAGFAPDGVRVVSKPVDRATLLRLIEAA